MSSEIEILILVLAFCLFFQHCKDVSFLNKHTFCGVCIDQSTEIVISQIWPIDLTIQTIGLISSFAFFTGNALISALAVFDNNKHKARIEDRLKLI